MKFQAILYPHTGQWVFQYATDGSNNASVALMSPTANDAISWACNDTSAISAGMAVCAFQKDNKPPELLKDKLYLETTALALGDLAAGAQISGDVVFSIDSDPPRWATTAFVRPSPPAAPRKARLSSCRFSFMACGGTPIAVAMEMSCTELMASWCMCNTPPHRPMYRCGISPIWMNSITARLATC